MSDIPSVTTITATPLLEERLAAFRALPPASRTVAFAAACHVTGICDMDMHPSLWAHAEEMFNTLSDAMNVATGTHTASCMGLDACATDTLWGSLWAMVHDCHQSSQDFSAEQNCLIESLVEEFNFDPDVSSLLGCDTAVSPDASSIKP